MTYTLGGGRGSKRMAEVPFIGQVVGEFASKADLLEALWEAVAVQCECADDEVVVARQIVERIQKSRARGGAPKFRLPKPGPRMSKGMAEALLTLRGEA